MAVVVLAVFDAIVIAVAFFTVVVVTIATVVAFAAIVTATVSAAVVFTTIVVVTTTIATTIVAVTIAAVVWRLHDNGSCRSRGVAGAIIDAIRHAVRAGNACVHAIRRRDVRGEVAVDCVRRGRSCIVIRSIDDHKHRIASDDGDDWRCSIRCWWCKESSYDIWRERRDVAR